MDVDAFVLVHEPTWRRLEDLTRRTPRTGAEADAQVLVWQDMAGLTTGRAPRFVKRYADLHSVLTEAVGAYVDEVRTGVFPEPERSFD